jgi:Putative transposase
VRRHLRLSLHAAVRCGADDRQALEQLCCYITRPALANERVQTNAAGQVVLKLKTPLARRHHPSGDFADGTRLRVHRRPLCGS